MKKLLLTTAIAGLAFTASPAMAEISLGLGGHFKGYMVWQDQDHAAGAPKPRSVDILRDTEIFFTGETTLDNGLTVGFHAEMKANGGDSGNFEESYAYFAGNWGRVNFGAEDGAQYLLQVAAPAADSNIDGLRQYINPINYASAGVTAPTQFRMDYAADASGYADKITYLTPVFSGFQVGLSYTPDVGSASSAHPDSGYAHAFGVRTRDVAGALGSAYEGAVRYEGQFEAARITLGAGYTQVELERKDPARSLKDKKDWNVGANIGYGPFNLGAAYVRDNNGEVGDFKSRAWVIGADYTTGPFVIGVSYYDREDKNAAPSGGAIDSNRYSGGVTYTYGPGMSFRGSLHHVKHKHMAPADRDIDATSFLLGTQINF